MRARRKAQSNQSVQEKSEKIAVNVESGLTNTAVDTVACYRAQENEVILDRIINSLVDSHVKVVLPVVRGRSMQFTSIDSSTVFVPNTWGIEEPCELDLVDPASIDLVFAPLVAFSSSGYRLGRGGGYYDRLFHNNDQTVFVGVGFDFQHSDEIVAHANDKPLDAVVTESGWRIFRTNNLVSDSEV